LKLLTTARDLKRRKAREKRSLFVAEGIRAVEELLGSGLGLEGVLVSAALSESKRGSALLERIRASGAELLEIGENELATASDTESPQGVIAIARVPQVGLESSVKGDRVRVVVLDGVQDPGNAGTILRTAAALGATATLALPGTVDLWNAKVVRSSMGAQFKHPSLSVTVEELANLLRREAIELWATDAGAEPLGATRPPAKLAIAVGNEGAGLSSTVRGLASHTVGLPIARGVESLNVAVATGIILYELGK
jgi:RNA methyltransferase, TrmH family